MENTKKIIDFNSKAKLNKELSNFHMTPFELDSIKWPTVEHYFQASKFLDQKNKDIILKCSTPAEAKKVGRHLSPLRKDWDIIKKEIMYKAVKAKFEQNEDLRKLLISTGDALLREKSRFDRFWAVGSKGNGGNELGKIMMRVRKELN